MAAAGVALIIVGVLVALEALNLLHSSGAQAVATSQPSIAPSSGPAGVAGLSPAPVSVAGSGPFSGSSAGPTFGGPIVTQAAIFAEAVRQGANQAEASFLAAIPGAGEDRPYALGAVNPADTNGLPSYGLFQINGVNGNLIGNVQSFLGSLTQQVHAGLTILRQQGYGAWPNTHQNVAPGILQGLRP